MYFKNLFFLLRYAVDLMNGNESDYIYIALSIYLYLL